MQRDLWTFTNISDIKKTKKARRRTSWQPHMYLLFYKAAILERSADISTQLWHFCVRGRYRSISQSWTKWEGSQDCFQWKTRVKAVTYRNAILFIAFRNAPDSSDDDCSNGVSWNAKTMTAIVLCLGDATIWKERELVDGDGTVHQSRILL